MLTIEALSGKRYIFSVVFGRLGAEYHQTRASSEHVFHYEIIMFHLEHKHQEILASQLLI